MPSLVVEDSGNKNGIQILHRLPSKSQLSFVFSKCKIRECILYKLIVTEFELVYELICFILPQDQWKEEHQ